MARQTIQNANASLYFNGSAYADTASNSTLSLANGFTVAGWIKVSKFITASTRQKMIATANWGFGVTSTTQKLSFTTISVKDYDSTGSSLQPGRWYFACAVLDSSNDVTFYLNGQLDSIVTHSVPANTAAGLTSLGRRPTPAATDYHIGNLSGVRVFNRELTATEILNLYNGTVPSGVIAEYLLIEGAGTVAYDTSGNGNNGTITSGTWSRDTPSKTRKPVNGNMVYNGDFEIAPVVNAAQLTSYRWLDGTVSPTSVVPVNKLFGIYFWDEAGQGSIMIDTSEKFRGKNSLKVSTLATGSYASAGLGDFNADDYISVLPSTSYTYSFWMKTNLVSGTADNGARIVFELKNGARSTTTSVASTTVKTTTDWTYYTGTINTASTTRFLTVLPVVDGDNGTATLIMDAWFADIQLYPTTPVTRSAATGRLTATGRSAA